MKTQASKLPQISGLLKLANVSIAKKDEAGVFLAFEQTLKRIENLKPQYSSQLKKSQQMSFHHIEKKFRADESLPNNCLSQEEALFNAKHKHQGYFMIKNPQLKAQE